MYNGVPLSDGSCNNTSEAGTLTMEQMNTNSNNIKYNLNTSSLADSGYMYNDRYVYSSKDVTSSNFKYGNSFTWNGVNYTLTDTVDSVGLPGSINTLHYTCFNTNGVCNKLNYIYGNNKEVVYYISLSGGEGVEQALDKMLYSSSVNKNNSNVKAAIDYWYQNNMTNFTNYLEDTVWCNDRSSGNILSNGWNPKGGSTLTSMFFKSATDKASLICKNVSDRFTVSKENGNGALTYPVGLLDEVERNLAYDNSSSSKSFLAIGINYWTNSPAYFLNTYIDTYLVNTVGSHVTWNVAGVSAVRPAISLKSETNFMSGNGSVVSPYVI